MGRRYSVSFTDVAVTVQQDLFQLEALVVPAKLLGCTISQSSDVGDAAAEGLSISCPAKGNWIASAFIPGRQLFNLLPKRFLNDVVALGMENNRLRIESQLIPARWEEA